MAEKASSKTKQRKSPEQPERTGKPVYCPSVKYTYDIAKSDWVMSNIMIRVPTPMKRFGKGGMRVCYEVVEINEDGTFLPMVAKFFRPNILDLTEKDYLNEAEVQCMCESFAENFNRARLISPVRKPKFSFLQCSVVKVLAIPPEYEQEKSGFFSFRVPNTGAVMFGMELQLNGRFTKYNSNYGETFHGDSSYKYTPEELEAREEVCRAAEAFSHFTLAESGGSMLVCDLQGVNDFLTDPQIHTENGDGLGMGNMGMAGIQKWIDEHKCNAVCKALALGHIAEGSPKISGLSEERESTVKEQYRRLRAMCCSTRPSLPAEIVPTKKLISEMTENERLTYALELSKLTS